MPIQSNPIEAMAVNQARLVTEKHRLKTEYERRAAEIDDEISKIDSAMEVVNAAIKPYLCPDCGGSGNHRVPDAAGQMENRPCPTCKGTGIAPNKKDGGHGSV